MGICPDPGPFVAVVDPRTPEWVGRRIEELGGLLSCVSESDGKGSFLESRLHAVGSIVKAWPTFRWTNQYSSFASRDIHHDTLAVELVAQLGPDPMTLVAAVSTGGTLTGVSQGLADAGVRLSTVAVDAAGSAATGGDRFPTLLTGIGAPKPSFFLRDVSQCQIVSVADTRAFAVCRLVREDTHLDLGGSTGAVVEGIVESFSEDWYSRADGRIVAIVSDGGDRYEHTIYSDRWLAERGAIESVVLAEQRLRRAGVSFEYEAHVDV